MEATQALVRQETTTALATMERLAAIPEEELWLQNQRSAHTRRAYKEDVRHFMQMFGIVTQEELRATNRAAVIAWVRKMEQDEEKPRTICRRLSALSSLFKHLMERHQVTDNPTDGVKRPAVGGDTGMTAAFDEAQARKILDAPPTKTLIGLRDRAILSVLLQAGPRRAEVSKMKVKDLHTNKGYPSLRYIRKAESSTASRCIPIRRSVLGSIWKKRGIRRMRRGRSFGPFARTGRSQRQTRAAFWIRM